MGTPSRPPEAPRSKRAEVEGRLVEATEALLAEDAAYSELRVEQIARRAGISRTAFYFHFHDKRALLTRLTGDVADQLYREAERWWSDENGDGAAELAGALRRVFGIYRDQAPLLRAVVEAAAYDPEVALYWRALVGRFVEATRERIEREQASGAVDAALPAQMIAFGLCWMTERSAYEVLMQGGDLGDAALAEALLAIWLGAVYGRPR